MTEDARDKLGQTSVKLTLPLSAQRSCQGPVGGSTKVPPSNTSLKSQLNRPDLDGKDKKEENEPLHNSHCNLDCKNKHPECEQDLEVQFSVYTLM